MTWNNNKSGENALGIDGFCVCMVVFAKALSDAYIMNVYDDVYIILL